MRQTNPVNHMQELEVIKAFSFDKSIVRQVVAIYHVYVEGYYEDLQLIKLSVDSILDAKGDPLDYKQLASHDFAMLGEFLEELRVDFDSDREELVDKMRSEFESELENRAHDVAKDR